MKILFFSRLYYPHVGGVEKHVHEISKRLLDQGHSVTIVTEEVLDNTTPNYQTEDSNASTLVPLPGLKVYRIPVSTQGKMKKFQIWRWLFKHQKLMQASDIIHCHDVFFWYLPFRYLYPKKPVFTTFHGYESFPVKKNAIKHRKLAEKLSKGSICIGEFMKKWYNAKPDMTLYGGANAIEKKESKKNFSALFIGRLDEQTGIDTYVKATELVQKSIPSFTLTIYGDGPLRNKIHGKGIEVKGFNKDADKELASHDLAFVSRYLAILEALRAKKIVVAVYDNPIKKDYLEMTPFAKYIIIASTPEEVYKKIKEVSLNPNRYTKIVEDGHSWAKTQTWEYMTEQYLLLWKKR